MLGSLILASIDKSRSDAWGNVLDEYIAPSAAVLVRIRYRFQGREWSAATGLVNFRMRWYDSETGRWLSKDPIGLSGGLNLYAFCGGYPVICRDPFGAAHVGSRPLDAEGNKEGQDLNNKLSTWNLPGDIDPRHAEIFFDDGEEPPHIGYGPNGVRPDESSVPYSLMETSTYDDKTMRDAVNNLKNSGNWNPKGSKKGGYNWLFHNCQDFIYHVTNEYNRLKK